MTLSGTNSYLINCGHGQIICIDPGPEIESHVQQLLDRASAMHGRIALVCLTHTHPDHAPAALAVRERTSAPIAAHAQTAFPHDRKLYDGDVLQFGDTRIRVMEAPGHTSDHVVYYEPRERALFTGDAVIGEGYVVIAPPGGSMRTYQRTLQRMLDEFGDVMLLYGGHGEPVTAPQAKLRDYIAHRQAREQEIISTLRTHAQTIPEIVQTVYRDTDPILWPAAARQVLAYLLALEQEGRVQSDVKPAQMSPAENAMLNPDWATIVGPEQLRTVQEELGATLRLDTVRVYRLLD
jgi:glyoxylase-like metal-dependent hydrolase (beta-lactamase superfamily II)